MLEAVSVVDSLRYRKYLQFSPKSVEKLPNFSILVIAYLIIHLWILFKSYHVRGFLNKISIKMFS